MSRLTTFFPLHRSCLPSLLPLSLLPFLLSFPPTLFPSLLAPHRWGPYGQTVGCFAVSLSLSEAWSSLDRGGRGKRDPDTSTRSKRQSASNTLECICRMCWTSPCVVRLKQFYLGEAGSAIMTFTMCLYGLLAPLHHWALTLDGSGVCKLWRQRGASKLGCCVGYRLFRP